MFQLTEVEKITKEEGEFTDTYLAKKKAKQTLRGYKGFFDIGYNLGVDEDPKYSVDTNKFEVSTSHGYQFNNYLYLGAGAALNYYANESILNVPFFANFRVKFNNRSIVPFGDLKLGYSAGDRPGAYGSFGIGLRFAGAKRSAINLLLEYIIQDYESPNYRYSGHSQSKDAIMSGIGFKIGIEF